MSKSYAIFYVMFSVLLIAVGIYIVRNITDLSNPNSLGSRFEQLKDTINENSDFP